jgi:hypothetical protein
LVQNQGHHQYLHENKSDVHHHVEKNVMSISENQVMNDVDHGRNAYQQQADADSPMGFVHGSPFYYVVAQVARIQESEFRTT